MDRSDRTRSWIALFSALGVIVTLGFVACEPQQSTYEVALHPDEAAIRESRAESNAAIAAHDVPGILASMREDVRVAGSSGRFLDGHDAVAEAFAAQFADYDDALYVRTPESVRLADSGETAAELGNWVGTWTTDAGPRRFGGQYSAYWWKTDGEWRIHSELFVPLFCEGADCE